MSYPHPERTPSGWEPPGGTPAGPGQPPPPLPPAQPPGYLGYPSAEPRRRRRWPWIVLGVIVLFLVSIGGCGWVLLQAARPPIDAANEWLALVDEERWTEAYDRSCPAVRRSLTAEEAEITLRTDFGDGVDAYAINQYNNSNGAVSVGGRVTVGGDQRFITLDMFDGADGWQVCGYDLTATDR